MKPNLIATVALVEDLEKNSEGFDKAVLTEAVKVVEFTEPVEGVDLLLELAKEGLI